MSAFDVDFFVIGGGSGGVRAARIAARHGASVALAEEYRMGGTCVIRGCVPKKLMVYAASFAQSISDARGFGWEVAPPRFNWGVFRGKMLAELDRLEGIYRANLDRSGVAIHDCRASVAGPHEVRLASGETIRARHILIATGGRPFVPDIPGAELGITSNDIFHLDALPKRIVFFGAGYIGCEFACVLRALGSEVHIVNRSEGILRGFDEDIRDQVREEMAARGIRFHFGATPQGLSRDADGITAILSDGSTITADQIVFATGRVPNVEGLGLETLGIGQKPNGAIDVDSWSQTAIPSIFAIGDVTDRIQLTPVAIREGHALADTLFAGAQSRADHDLVASAVFTRPEAGTVGLTETEARTTHDVAIYRTRFRPMYAAFAGQDSRMMMKIVVDKTTDKVLGVHLVGDGAGELIQAVAIAVKMGATKAQFDATVAVHPTAAEELVTLRDPIESA